MLRYLLPMILFITSCGNTKKTINTNMSEPFTVKAYIRQSESIDMGGNFFTIENAYIKGNNMYVVVKSHPLLTENDFDLTGSPVISKSLPPIRTIRLEAKKAPLNNGDTKNAMVEKILIFDVSALAYKQEANAQIYLQFEGKKEGILYTFQ